MKNTQAHFLEQLDDAVRRRRDARHVVYDGRQQRRGRVGHRS